MANPIIAHEVAIINDPFVPIGDKVDAAAHLWQLIVDCGEALDSFKTSVRKIALASGQASLTINGNGLSQCKVNIPKPSLGLKDGLIPEDERIALGDLFNTIYEVKLQLRKSDPTFLDTFPQSAQAHMAGVTTLVNNIPRVSLKTLPNVDEIG